MKTIVVIFTKEKVTDSDQIKGMKQYSFNTDSEVKVGNLIKTNKYDALLQVARVLDKGFKYYDAKTGQMSNEYSSTNQFEIKTLEIRDAEDPDVITGVIVE